MTSSNKRKVDNTLDTMQYQSFLILVVLVLCSIAKETVSSVSALPNPHSLFRKYQLSSNQSASTPTSLEKVLYLRGGTVGGDVTSLDWRYFLAGGICAAASHGYTTPIDVVKTRMQAFPEKYDKGVLAAARDIVKEEGLSYLLTGLGPTVVGYGLEGALKFGSYEACKGIFKTLTSYTVLNFLLASVVAGSIASIVLCPMEEARIKMVGDKSWQKENVVSGMMRLVSEKGLFASFSGLPAMLAKQVPYTMGKQVSFDVFAAMLYAFASQLQLSEKHAKWMISMGAASLSSLMACLLSQPGDMILTATHNHSGNETSIATFGSIVRKIYYERGYGGFYLGLQARLAHVASIITFQLVLYDIIKLALGLPVTGAH